MEDKKLLAEFLGYEVKHGSSLLPTERFLGDWFSIYFGREKKPKNTFYFRYDQIDCLSDDVYQELDTYFDIASFDILAQAGKKFCDIPEMKYSIYAHNIKTAWAEFDTEKTFNALIEGIKLWDKYKNR